MLCQYTIKNYKSLRDEITLDLQAATITEHEEKIIVMKNGEKFLPISVIYGPNGGGKSNVIEALEVLVSKVLRPVFATGNSKEYELKKMPIKPFAFSERTKEVATEFEVFFRTKSSEYRYILHVKEEIVVYESLDRIKLETGRRAALFERTHNNEVILKGNFARLKISEDISGTLPFLSYLGITYKKNEIISEVFKWFEFGITFLNYGNPLQELSTAMTKSDDLKQLVLKIIKEIDLEIEDFRIEEKEGNVEVYMKHIVDDYSTEILLCEESSGTQKLFGILPFLVRSLIMGTTLIIDELDAKIHPILLKYIIELFTHPESNKRGAQLIFTSHDLSTMNSEIFRRDEIWFVAKGNAQNSKLYSLVDFKNNKGESVRKDAKFDKQYLEGKYGADPYLKKIIDWGRVNA